MTKSNGIRLFSFILVVLVSICVMNSGSLAWETELNCQVREIAQVNSTDNDTLLFEPFYDHGYAPNISASLNTDGTVSVCIKQDDFTLKIFHLSADGTVKGSITVPCELHDYAAFTSAPDGTYYILFGNSLSYEQCNETALRLVNYSKSGQKLRSLDMSGYPSDSIEGIAQLECGNNALAANSKFVTGYVGRSMFSFSAEGLVHQASYAFAVKLSDFTKVYRELSYEIPYASHSFHQYILKDGNDFIYVDRCDALPVRAFHLTKMTGGSDWSMVSTGDSFTFKGEYADNLTYSQLGGIVRTNKGYMLCGTYENVHESTDDCSANLFVQRFDSNLGAGQVTYLTNLTDTGSDIDSVISPKIVKISDYQSAIVYMVCNNKTGLKELRLSSVNSDAQVLSDTGINIGQGAVLPRLGQVLYNPVSKSVIWFSIADSKLVMNSIDIRSTIVPEPTAPSSATTQPTTQRTEAPTVTNTTPSTTENPTQPSTTQQSCFLQQILNFFIGIYNWFVGLFANIFA